MSLSVPLVQHESMYYGTVSDLLPDNINPEWLGGVLQQRETILHEGHRAHEASLTVLPRQCSIIRYEEEIGKGTEKRIEEVVVIHSDGRVQKMAEASGSHKVVGEEYEIGRKFDSDHVVRPINYYEENPQSTLTKVIKIIIKLAIATLFVLAILAFVGVLSFPPFAVTLILIGALFGALIYGAYHMTTNRPAFFLEERFEGDLEKFLKDHRNDPNRRYHLANICAGLAEGLKHMHRRGFTHVDFHIGNAFIRRIGDTYTGVVGDLSSASRFWPKSRDFRSFQNIFYRAFEEDQAHEVQDAERALERRDWDGFISSMEQLRDRIRPLHEEHAI